MRSLQSNIILFLIGGFILIIIIIFLYIWSRNTYHSKLFNNLSNKVPSKDSPNSNIGGILVSMMKVEDFENLLKIGDVNLYNYHWTYMRKDICPMTYMNSGPSSRSLGIIINPEKIWDLISNMTVTNSNNSFYDISRLQYSFDKKEWGNWIKTIKNYYRSVINLMQPTGAIITKYSNEMANPYYQNHLENKVNLDIDSNNKSNIYKKQNKIFQDSIIGFFFVKNTCEDQLASLKGIKTYINNIPQSTFISNIDRCDGFFYENGDNPEWSPIYEDDRRTYEKRNINKSKDLAIKVTYMFNKKHNKNIPIFSATPDSNLFYNYNQLKKAIENKINFNDIFTKIN